MAVEMETSKPLMELMHQMQWFLVSQLDFSSEKTYRRVREIWDKNNLSYLQVSVRRMCKEVLTSHMFIRNDCILPCLAEEWVFLLEYASGLRKGLQEFKQVPELKDLVETYMSRLDKKTLESYMISDLISAGETIGVDPDIKTLLSNAKGRLSEAKSKGTF